MLMGRFMEPLRYQPSAKCQQVLLADVMHSNPRATRGRLVMAACAAPWCAERQKRDSAVYPRRRKHSTEKHGGGLLAWRRVSRRSLVYPGNLIRGGVVGAPDDGFAQLLSLSCCIADRLRVITPGVRWTDFGSSPCACGLRVADHAAWLPSGVVERGRYPGD